MKWHLCLVGLGLAAAACQSGEAKDAPPGTTGPNAGSTKIIQLPKAEATPAYRADITTLCDVVRLSGADQKPKDERWPIVAVFLGPNLKTAEAHEFLIAVQPLAADVKALALETEAKRVGLAKCALAADWRAAAAGT